MTQRRRGLGAPGSTLHTAHFAFIVSLLSLTARSCQLWRVDPSHHCGPAYLAQTGCAHHAEFQQRFRVGDPLLNLW